MARSKINSANFEHLVCSVAVGTGGVRGRESYGGGGGGFGSKHGLGGETSDQKGNGSLGQAETPLALGKARYVQVTGQRCKRN